MRYRILILGANGKLGGYLVRSLAHQHQVFYTLRTHGLQCIALNNAFPVPGVLNAATSEGVQEALEYSQPNVVINCIAVTPSLISQVRGDEVKEVNGIFPHRLADTCARQGVYVIHFSTDAVFSGKRGNYSEEDIPDPEDEYGRSKLAGEVCRRGVLTLRTAFYGSTPWRPGLVDWLLAQKGKVVNGYQNHYFTGLSLSTIRATIEAILCSCPRPEGIFHLGGTRFSKFTLLQAVATALELNVLVYPQAIPVVDRSLISLKLFSALATPVPTWESSMQDFLNELAESV